jgi:inosine-uridine nucleoside N-ribohydrolase
MMRTLANLLICCMACIPLHGAEHITIQNANTDNPTLLYKQKPMLKTGPVSEDRVFMYAIGSDFFDHKAWFDYMEDFGFGFARVYPAHTWYEDQRDRSTKPLHPFEVRRYTKEGDPVVDLLKADREYWANFSRVLDEAEKRDIVVCIQLYQRWYWGNRAPRKRLFFQPTHNVNDIDEIYPDRVWKNMSDAYPDGKLWVVHRNFVNEVLNSVGHRRNVMIDLMNEGAIAEGMTKEWIEHTLEIIEAWEQKNGRDILVGMDIDHFLMKKDIDSLHWLLSHPSIEIIVGEDKWIYFSTDEMISMRSTYRKPMIWVNEKAVGYMDTFSLCDYPNRRLHYLWMGLMTKIQGLGLYDKENHTQLSLLEKPQAKELGDYNRTLMRFFDNDIKDYALLRNQSNIIKKAPALKHRVALASPKEVIVYLHKGFEQKQPAGAKLELGNLSLPGGSVPVKFVHPNTGKSSTYRALINKGGLTLTLPEFYENLAIAITSEQKTEYTKKRMAILSRDAKSRKVPKIPPKGRRIRVIFDTDAKNEIDDVWAIALAILCPERFKIEGFVAANFDNSRPETGPDSVEASFKEIHTILEKAGLAGKWPVLRGSHPMRYKYEPSESEGVDFIIEKAMESTPEDPLWIVGLGAATDIASAYLKEPRIKDRIVVFWHFRTRWPDKCWNFNVIGDVRAARTVFHSDMSFVLFDTGTHLYCPMEESERYLSYGPLGRYMHEYRYGGAYYQRPNKGFFDLGDIAVLVDPSLGSWEVADCPEVEWDLVYKFKGTKGKILRCYDVDRDRTYALLEEKLRTHAGK